MTETDSGQRAPLSDWDFARRVIIALALAGAAVLLWQLASVLMLIFAAVLVGVLIHSGARRLSGWTGLRHSHAVMLATLLLLAALGGFVWLVWGQLAGQMGEVLRAAPKTLESLAASIGVELDFKMPGLSDLVSGEQLANGVAADVARYSVTVFGSLVEVLLVIGAGVFLALSPRTYRRGALLLLPRGQRPRVAEAMDHVGSAMAGWFLGQFIIMVAVGLMSFAAYWLVGLPSALALGVIAGVLNFVPMLGPFLAGGIAVLTAVPLGGSAILWTLVAAIAIQEVESLLLSPRVQEWTVEVPAAVVIFSLAVFGALFGLPGVLLAVPLALTVLVAVQHLWVNEALGEDVEVAGS